MTDKGSFSDPKVLISRVYTRGGDAGQTSLASGERLAKDHPRIAAYGAVDELGALTGLARLSAREAAVEHDELSALAGSLLRVQHELFNLGAELATSAARTAEGQPRVRAAEVARLESDIDRYNASLGELSSFVLAGGSRLSAELHHCRTVCRRVERLCVGLARDEGLESTALAYLNRLGDALFVWARWADRVQGVDELLWDPNAVDHG